jgi:hypothetical protein
MPAKKTAKKVTKKASKKVAKKTTRKSALQEAMAQVKDLKKLNKTQADIINSNTDVICELRDNEQSNVKMLGLMVRENARLSKDYKECIDVLETTRSRRAYYADKLDEVLVQNKNLEDKVEYLEKENQRLKFATNEIPVENGEA